MQETEANLPLMQRVHSLLNDDVTVVIVFEANYLTLTYTGAEWVASFDNTGFEADWFERENLALLKFAARAATMDEAIEDAAAKVLARFGDLERKAYENQRS